MSQAITINGKDYYKHPFISNYLANKDGDIYSLISKKILSKNRTNGNGYLTFCYYDNKKRKEYYQHRFIWEVFNGVIPKDKQTDHENGVRNDNRIENLQILTPKQNIQKSHNKPIVSINFNTGDIYRHISIKVASEDLNISKSTISKICNFKQKNTKRKEDGNIYTFSHFKF